MTSLRKNQLRHLNKLRVTGWHFLKSNRRVRAIFLKTSHNAIMNFVTNFMFTLYITLTVSIFLKSTLYV
jgi:hypothetical protein